MSRRHERALPVRRSVRILVAAAALAGLLTITAIASGTGSALRASSAATALTPGATYTAAKSLSGNAARTDRSLLGLRSSRLINVMIKYDFDALASYAGGIQGLRATSPRATGKSFARNRLAVVRYSHYTAKRTARINRAVVPRARIGTAFRTVYGGIAARVPANQIAKLLRVRGIDAVQRDALRQPLDDNTTFIGAQAVWPSLGGNVHAGENVKVGVIDTGIWPEHPMMADAGLPSIGGSHGCQFGDGSDTAHLGPTFTCNNKLIAAYAKTATYMSAVGANANEFCNNTTHQCSARDSEGHGTHTTTTAAGDCVAPRCCTASSAARSAASPPARMSRCSASASRPVASAPTPWRRSRRPSPTA